jgi:hypothetical protein
MTTSVIYRSALKSVSRLKTNANRHLIGTVEHARLQRVADDARNVYANAMEKLSSCLSLSSTFRLRVAKAIEHRYRTKMLFAEAKLELAKATSRDDETIQELGAAYRDAADAYRDVQMKVHGHISST